MRVRSIMLLTLIALAPSVAQAKPSRADEKRAIELVTRAAQHYRAKEFVEAAALFYEAYELSKIPNQLRNAAKAYTDGGRDEDALTLWKRYAEHSDLTGDERSEAQTQIALIEERFRAAEAEQRAKEEAERKAAEPPPEVKPAIPEPPPQPPPEPSVAVASRQESESTPPIGAYVAIGAGALAGIAGVAMFAHASSRLSDLDAGLATKNAGGRVIGIDRSSATAELSSINVERNASLIAALAGGAAIGAGIILWITHEEDSPAVAISPDGAAISWSTSW